MRKVFALVLGLAVLLPTAARAEKERKSPLTDAPVIRKRFELRDKRFEFGVGAGVFIGQDFYNALLVMPKLAFHFTDWISLAAVGGFNVTPGWKSSFNSDLTQTPNGPLHDETGAIEPKSPYLDEALYGMNRIGYLVLGQAEFIPLSGKIALLSSVFSYFDFYVLLGGGVVNLTKTDAPSPACQTSTDHPCHGQTQPYMATEATFTWGVGAHAFLSRYAAINLELHDLIYKNNPSGRDVNGDSVVNSYDLEWTNNWLFSLNLQFFAPFKTKVSR